MKTHQNIESTGTNALDAIIGNGSTILNSIILLDENKTSTEHYCDPIQRCFLAEGLEQKQRLFVAGFCTSKIEKLFAKIPIKSKNKSDRSDLDYEKRREVEADPLRIAWRYQTLPQMNSSITVAENPKFAHNIDETKFDLSQSAHLSIIELMSSGDLIVYDSKGIQPSLAGLWQQIYQEIEMCKGKNRILRILLSDLSSPVWIDPEMLPLFMAHLRTHCRDSNSMALISLNSLILEPCIYQSCIAYSDAVFQLKWMDENEQKVLHLRQRIDGGRFCILKLPTLRSAAPTNVPASLDLLFSLRRRFFEIKLLHLPPALGNSEKSGKGVPKAQMACQSFADHF